MLAGTLLALVAAVLATSTLEVQIQDNDGGVGESAAGREVLDERFPPGTKPLEQLLISHPELTVDDSEYRAIAEALYAELEELPHVLAISSFYESGDSSLASEDLHVLRAEVKIDPELDQDSRIDEVLSVVADARESAKGDGVAVAIAGIETTFREVNVMVEEDFGRILFISLGIGLVILLLAFRSVVAAAIPLGMAIGAITIANGIAALASQSYALNESYTEMILLLGLAVGIDYSLFIVSRYRREREAGKDKIEAITFANNTAGRAVF